MRFTCDRCHGDYQADRGSAVAHLYIKDRRCNHLEARCSHCGTTEVIFLGPTRIEEAIRLSGVSPHVHVEADGELRVRAERAWLAVDAPPVPRAGQGEEPPPVPESPPESLPGTGPATSDVDQVTGRDTLRRYALSDRHEELIERFGSTLGKIPDDLFWDSLRDGHDPRHPERWTD